MDAQAVQRRLLERIRLHPRIAHQKLFSTPEEQRRLIEALPMLAAFPGEVYHDLVAVVDWDHRLPSNFVVVRVYGYYSASSAKGGEAHYARRLEELNAEDKFPEFDVPDFVGLVADEEYEALFSLDGRLDRCRLRSPWRHQVDDTLGRVAVDVAKHSDVLRDLEREHGEREASLGGPEAAGWCPPCESGHARWTVDVWYLLSLSAMGGEGRSFLVDPDERRVVAVRSFLVRP